MSMPAYVSLKNQANDKYRNNHATKMQDNYDSPECLFNLVPQSNGSYGIKNVDNDQYFQCNITSMADSISSDCQRWQFLPIPTITNGFYIQNLENLQYLTKKASQLSKNARSDEVYIIEEKKKKIIRDRHLYKRKAIQDRHLKNDIITENTDIKIINFRKLLLVIHF